MFYLFPSPFVSLHPPPLAVRSAAVCFLWFRRRLFSPRFAAFSLALIFFSSTPRAARPRSVWPPGGNAPAAAGGVGAAGGAPARTAPQPRSGLLSPQRGQWRRGGRERAEVFCGFPPSPILEPTPATAVLIPRDRDPSGYLQTWWWLVFWLFCLVTSHYKVNGLHYFLFKPSEETVCRTPETPRSSPGTAA